MLDAYLPPESDKRDKRPVVVHIHGGSFTGGSKSSVQAIKYASELTMRGYAVVSIEYRLTGSIYHESEGNE